MCTPETQRQHLTFKASSRTQNSQYNFIGKKEHTDGLIPSIVDRNKILSATKGIPQRQLSAHAGAVQGRVIASSVYWMFAYYGLSLCLMCFAEAQQQSFDCGMVRQPMYICS